MTEVVPYVSHPPAPSSFAAEWLLDPAEIAQRIGGTDFVPQALRGNPAAITAALLYGAEVGLGRMQSLAMIAVINGRPTLAAQAQRALILHAGHELWIDESTVSRCTVAGRRKDSEQVSRITWTMDDARRAGLAGKPPWKNYPRQMLLARASAELARAIFPDAIGGLAATEELEDDPGVLNGATPAAPAAKSSRRKRSSVTSSEAVEPAPPTPDTAGITADLPTEAQEPTTQVSRVEEHTGPTPPLPADEQAVVDQLEADFDATQVEDSQGRPAGQPLDEPVTDAQRKKLHAMFRDKGIADRAERLRYCGGVVGRPIPTSTDLTKAEASQVIEHLDQYDPANPQTHPLPDEF